ncbi:MAG: hypothetical protein C5B50_25115 [Verrucomicrobia bacterium]|nr:MAG: hypothetical protein C5B50_25115 [Verrucomicrobiota bacterium]
MTGPKQFHNPEEIVSSSPGLRVTRYPGSCALPFATPTGLCPRSSSQPQPLRGDVGRLIPRVARSSQPWALRRNPFGIQGSIFWMRLAFACVFINSIARAEAVPTGPGIKHAHIAGRECVRLADWGKAQGLEMRWIKRDESFEFRGNGKRLSFTTNSREIEIAGVRLWLLFPLVAQNGDIYIAQQDVQTTIQPVLTPSRNSRGAKINTICLDPGHGGKDPGERAAGNVEKQYTLLLAEELRGQLTRAGLKTVLTRTTDTFIELPTRPELAKRRGADLFVSLHFNSIDTSRDSVKGAEVYCLTPSGAPSTNAQGEGGGGWCIGNRDNDRNMLLAYEIQKALGQIQAVEDRGVRRARFAVLRDATMPAVLVEGGFMSHPIEGRKILTPGYRRQLARAIAEGVLSYKKIVERG